MEVELLPAVPGFESVHRFKRNTIDFNNKTLWLDTTEGVSTDLENVSIFR